MSEEKVMSKEDVQALLASLNEYIADAKDIVERGEYMELAGLDERVKTLCDSVMSLKVEESMSFADELDATMKELDSLQKMFVQSRDKLASDMQDVGKHKQAAVAYKQSETAPHREGMTGDTQEASKE